MKFTERNKCVVCRNQFLDDFFELKDFPIYMGVTTKESSEDVFFDQSWMICKYCKTIQLSKLLPLELLYPENHNAVIGHVWKTHHEKFRDFILEDEIASICEIGASHGYLAGIILDKVPMEYLVIEPNPLIHDPRIVVIDGFIEDHLFEVQKYDAIVHSHVLEHIYDPFSFVFNLAKRLKKGGAIYISFPNIERLIFTLGSNSLNFEHTYYLHPKNFEWMIQEIGMKIDRRYSFEEHSFFYKCTIELQSEETTSRELPELNVESRKFIDMWQSIDRFVKETNVLLENIKTEIFIFGAHVFAQGLLHCGLRETSISGILDNDPIKEGKRLYGTNLFVNKPDILENLVSPVVILKASHYQEEIKTQILSINATTLIVE
jgi:hypothetical protein